MSRKNTQNTKPEEVKEVVEETVVDAEIVEEVVETAEKKVPFWKRPKVQKVGKIAAVIAAIGGAAVAGVMLGKKTTSDDENLTEEDYMEKLTDFINENDIPDGAYAISLDSEKDTAT